MTLSSRVKLMCLTGALTLLVAGYSSILVQAPAYALSDIKDITPVQPDPAQAEDPKTVPDDEAPVTEDAFPVIPDPDPLIKKDETEEAAPVDPEEPAPEVIYDLEKAPEPVRRMRELIMEAAKTGDIEKLRPLLNPGPNQTQVPLQTAGQDPIAALKGRIG